MTAQAKPQAWMQWCLDLGKTTALGAVRTVAVALWLLAAVFVSVPTANMMVDYWAATPLWQGVKDGWNGKPSPASVLPQAKAKGAK